MITEVNSYAEFKRVLDEKTGFVSAHWDGTLETEIAIKDETKATIRCIPLDAKPESGVCIIRENLRIEGFCLPGLTKILGLFTLFDK
jgi:hypothetical protein